MLSSLLAYDVNGEVIATLDFCVSRDQNGKVSGLIDFAAHENNGGKLRDIWNVGDAVGSGTWPEWLGVGAHGFKVERENGRIVRLIHKQSGHARDRSSIEQGINQRIAEAGGRPADIRDLVGGPDRHLVLDDEGKTRPPVKPNVPNLPTVGMQRGGKTSER